MTILRKVSDYPWAGGIYIFLGHLYPLGVDHLRNGDCSRDADCINKSDWYMDGGCPGVYLSHLIHCSHIA